MSSTACLSCNGGTQTSGDAPANRLLVATLRGLVAFERDETNAGWRETGRTLEDLHISAILSDTDNALIFVAAHGKGGVWKSIDGGASFIPCAKGIDNLNVYALAAQRRNDRTILFAGAEPASLYRSIDLGASWQELPALRDVPNTDLWTFPPPPHFAHVKNTSFHPRNSDTLFALVEQGALLKSTDGGASWDENLAYASGDDFFHNDVHRLLLREDDPDRMVMSSGEGIYRTSDGGVSWEHITKRDDRIGYPDAMFIDPRDPDTLFVGGPRHPPRVWGATGTADATVLRSRDFGTSWEEVRTGFPDEVIGNIEAMGLHHAGDHVMLTAGTAKGEVYISEDDGDHWTLLASGLPPISKGGHYRWFLSAEEKERIENKMRASGNAPAVTV
jgi:photosystem II stability/assembly factor-like uncharacterized protein